MKKIVHMVKKVENEKSVTLLNVCVQLVMTMTRTGIGGSPIQTDPDDQDY
jgi:hypothetical protein